MLTVQGATDALSSVPREDRIRLLLMHRHSQNFPRPVGLCKVSFTCSLLLHLFISFGKDENYLFHHGFYKHAGTRSSLHLPFLSWQDICPQAEFYVKCKDKHLQRNLPNFLKNCLI